MPVESLTNAKLRECFTTVGMGIVGDSAMPLNHVDYWKGTRFQRHQYWHHKAIGTAIVANQETLFFAVAPDGVQASYTNPKTIVGGQSGFWMCHLSVDIKPQYQPDGTAETDGEPYQVDADPPTVAADIAALLRFGQLRVRVNKFEKTYTGLHNFPPGGGPVVEGNIGNTTATTLTGLVNVNNGQQNTANKFPFTPPWEIFPDDPVEVAIRWPFSRTLKDTYTLSVVLEGVLVELG